MQNPFLETLEIRENEVWEFDNGKDEPKKYIVGMFTPNQIMIRPYPPENDVVKDIYTQITISKKTN